MKSEDKELFLHLKQYIESIERDLQAVKDLIEIGLADDDEEILPDAQESVEEEDSLKIQAKPTLTKQQKQLKLAEGRARAQLWAADLQAKRKGYKTGK